MMSSTGGQKRSFVSAAKRVWSLGGLRAYYRGLTVSRIRSLNENSVLIFFTDWSRRGISVSHSI